MLLKEKIPFKFLIESVWLEAIILPICIGGIYALQFLDWWMGFSLPLTVIAMLGTAISLLLAFRTSQSYDRWWEARIIWGGIVNDSRSLVRQLMAFTGPEAESEVRTIIHRMAYRQIGWCYCLGQSLRGQDALEGMDKFLGAEDISAISDVDNAPNALLQRHSADLRLLVQMGAIDGFGMIQLDSTIARLCDHMGKCERIKSTVFPSTYSLFIHCFIYLFVLSIPFGLGEDFGMSEIPLSVGIGLAFFLIEKTSKFMQDPFENRPTDTAMTTIATNIYRNIVQMLAEGEEIPERFPSKSYYSM